MKKSEDGFRESIKKAFAALAYEDSAEMLPLSKKHQLLSGRTMDRTAKDRVTK